MPPFEDGQSLLSLAVHTQSARVRGLILTCIASHASANQGARQATDPQVTRVQAARASASLGRNHGRCRPQCILSNRCVSTILSASASGTPRHASPRQIRIADSPKKGKPNANMLNPIREPATRPAPLLPVTTPYAEPPNAPASAEEIDYVSGFLSMCPSCCSVPVCREKHTGKQRAFSHPERSARLHLLVD